MTQQLIQQTRFARVRTTHDGRADAATQNLSFIRSAQQVVHELNAAFQSRQKLVARVGRDVFIGKIDVRLDVRERFHEFIAKRVDALGKFAGKLFVRGGKREFRARGNKVGDSFGLREVDAAIQKGALGEFSR